jgi:hypothetical protein
MVILGGTFGTQSDDNPFWVEETGVVPIAINYAKAHPASWHRRPKDNGHITSFPQQRFCVTLVLLATREGKVVILGPCSPVHLARKKLPHPRGNLCVIEKPDIPELFEHISVQRFPRNVARSI